jgi:hypothetical protein
MLSWVEAGQVSQERGFTEESPAQHVAPDDEHIRLLLARLARPHRSGGRVIERATLLAEGADFKAVMTWIEAHGGESEALPTAPAQRGLHSARTSSGTGGEQTPLRFILPASALH